MKKIMTLAAVFITGIISVLVVQRFYRGFYEKWKFFAPQDAQADGQEPPPWYR